VLAKRVEKEFIDALKEDNQYLRHALVQCLTTIKEVLPKLREVDQKNRELQLLLQLANRTINPNSSTTSPELESHSEGNNQASVLDKLENVVEVYPLLLPSSIANISSYQSNVAPQENLSETTPQITPATSDNSDSTLSTTQDNSQQITVETQEEKSVLVTEESAQPKTTEEDKSQPIDQESQADDLNTSSTQEETPPKTEEVAKEYQPIVTETDQNTSVTTQEESPRKSEEVPSEVKEQVATPQEASVIVQSEMTSTIETEQRADTKEVVTVELPQTSISDIAQIPKSIYDSLEGLLATYPN
jgi:hypothetical protein